MDDTEVISGWLDTEFAQRRLEKIIQRIASDLSTAKIRPPFLETPADRMEDVLPVLRSELSLFILEDRAHIKALIAARDPKLPAYLHQAFLNHCIDLARRSGLDPLRYFRKRAREVFRLSPRIHRRLKDGRFSMFSLHAENEEVQLPQDSEHCAIELPHRLAEKLDYSAACKKENMIELAVHFWSRLSDIMGGMRVWVDLRDFVKWVACYVPMHVGIESTEGKGYSDEPDSMNPDPLEIVPSGDQPLPPPTDDQLEALAAAFAGRLDQEDRAVFYYRFFEEMKWDEIARRTGFKGPSGPSYRFERAKDVLKVLLREWPGLSPEDEDPETTDRFWEKLRAILKECLPVP